MYLLKRIESYLRKSGTPATKFGREVLGDPRFVFDLRKGREPREATEARVASYIDAHEVEARPPCNR
ncbi:MAG TPA: hypothetical protein VF589_12940 [Allosphingosinicella sp.]|jgi:2,4-dienoyl-CoA reductase-like NADH-dependent reductase (Old Yellow Enzyme family)